MFYTFRYLLLISLVFTGAAHAGQVLSLAEAERLAQELDPSSKRLTSLALAMKERSVADGQLPDPKFRFGLMNFPTDTFNRDQEPMTQIQLGMQQMIPRGDSLNIKTRRSLSQASSNEYRALDRQRLIQKQVRLKWLELFYWNRAQEVVEKNRGLFEQLVEVSQYHYASGRRNQQDVLRAQLELSKLDDRILEIKTRQEKIRAELGVLIGLGPVSIHLPEELPSLELSVSLEQLSGALPQHPKVLVAKAQVAAGKQGVELAREAYKPGWMLGVTYGVRDGQNPNGSDRPDFLSVGVTVDIPLFREKRQDRRLAASQLRLGAHKLNMDQKHLDLKQMLERDYAEWQRLEQRNNLYRDVLMAQAKQNTEASLFAYQNDRTDFATLMQARITELNTRLKSIRINVNRVKAQARLHYLSGEEK